MPETYYRWVKTDPPTEADFIPRGAMGEEMRYGKGDPKKVRAWYEGLSFWNSLESATDKAQQNDFAGGSYVVKVTLEDGHEFEVEGPAGKDRDHYTIYGGASELLAQAYDLRKMDGAP